MGKQEDVASLNELKSSLEKKVEALEARKQGLELEVVRLTKKSDDLKDRNRDAEVEFGRRLDAVNKEVETKRAELEKERISCAKERQKVNADAEANEGLKRQLTLAIQRAETKAKQAESAIAAAQQRGV